MVIIMMIMDSFLVMMIMDSFLVMMTMDSFLAMMIMDSFQDQNLGKGDVAAGQLRVASDAHQVDLVHAGCFYLAAHA